MGAKITKSKVTAEKDTKAECNVEEKQDVREEKEEKTAEVNANVNVKPIVNVIKEKSKPVSNDNRVSTMTLKKRAFRKEKNGFQGFSQPKTNAEGTENDGSGTFFFVEKNEGVIAKDDDTKQAISNALVAKPDASILVGDLHWLLDKLTCVQVEKDTLIFEKNEHCPYFFLSASGSFTFDDEVVTVANIESLLSDAPTKGKFVCKESGTLWFSSRLEYQQLKVQNLQEKISKGESLLHNIREIPGLKDLPKEQLEQMSDALTEQTFVPGEMLMQKGDEGNCMFFIQSGEVLVTKVHLNKYKLTGNKIYQETGRRDSTFVNVEALSKEDEGKNILVVRKAGEYIGEGALLESLGEGKKIGTRNANVIAFTEVNCLILQRADFELHMGSLKELFEHNHCIRILSSLDLLESLTQAQLMLIASLIEERVYEIGSSVVSQGEKGEEFFILKDGTLECLLDGVSDADGATTGNRTSVGSLLPGDYFGEGALLTSEPRRCHVVVVGDKEAKLWVLSKTNFDKCLSGGVKETLQQIFKKRKEAKEGGNISGRKNEQLDFSFSDLENIKTLGSGSYGTVELVRNKVTGQTLALKRIRKSTVVAKRQQRFVNNEREILISMESPFVINLVKTFKTQDSVFMLFELCLGGELYSFMKRAVDAKLENAGIKEEDLGEEDEVLGCFDITTQVRFFTACIVLAIEYIQQQGVIHRDIKPENLMIGENGYLKLVDFGFAKQIFGQRTYSLCGTPEYTAPEVFKRVGHGKQVDYWALGVIVYEMSSGFSPFHIESQNSWDCYQEISKYERFYPKIQFPGTFTQPLERLLLDLMHPNPVKRYGTMKMTSLDLKQHDFFKDLDWNAIESQQYVLPQEFRPSLPEYGLDARNFNDDCTDRHVHDHEKVPIEVMESDATGWDNDF